VSCALDDDVLDDDEEDVEDEAEDESSALRISARLLDWLVLTPFVPVLALLSDASSACS
jgi:hypothetical protein